MRLPRDLSGRDFIKSVCRKWGYREVHQIGSHIILQTEIPFPQRISVPNHKNLKLGTLNSLLKLVASQKGVHRDDVLKSLL